MPLLRGRRPALLAGAVLGLLIGGIAAGLAYLHVRAADAVRRHQSEVDRYFAQSQDLESARGPVFSPPLPGNAWDVYRRVLGEIESTPTMQERIRSWKFEVSDGTALLSVYAPMIEELRSALSMPEVPPPDRGRVISQALNTALLLTDLAEALVKEGRVRDALNVLIAAFGLAQDFCRVVPAEDVGQFLGTLLHGTEVWLRSLAFHDLASEDLEALGAQLERLDRAFPTLAESWEWSRLYWKRKAFQEVLADGKLPEKPSWKDLFSRTPARARFLGEIDECHRANAERGRRPSWERVKRVDHGERDHAAVARRYGVYFCCIPNNLFELEVKTLEVRTLLRLAMAVARYERDTETLPHSLAHLVPRSLANVTPSPLTGKAVAYANGTFTSMFPGGKVDAWPVRSRP